MSNVTPASDEEIAEGRPPMADPVNLADVQRQWYEWRSGQAWDLTPLDLAAKVAEEAGEVLGATLKLTRTGHADTHPDHDLEHLGLEVGQLLGTLLCLAEHFHLAPATLAAAELERVKVRFPITDPEATDG